MAAYDNAYSRLVAWLKVLLPLIALVILSTVFLVSQRYDPEASIPYSRVEIDELLRDQRISSPRYAGVTEDGSAIRIGAETAKPDDGEPARLSAEGLTARIETPGGGWLDIAAGAGTIDQSASTARMQGKVHILSSSGYDVRTDALNARLDSTELKTDGAVEAEGPIGRLTAGRMALAQPDTPGAGYVLDFNGGVHLIYLPPEG